MVSLETIATRPGWLISLDGDEEALAWLGEQFRSDAFGVLKLDGGWALYDEQLCDSADEAHASARRSVVLLNSVCHRLYPGALIDLGDGARRLNTDGSITVYRSQKMSYHIAHSSPPAALGAASYADQCAELARAQPDVFEILEYHEISREGGFADLHRVVEGIAKDVSNVDDIDRKDGNHYDELERRGWAPHGALERLRTTANSRCAGATARHGLSDDDEPLDPMSLGEAHQLVNRLFYDWIDWRLQQR